MMKEPREDESQPYVFEFKPTDLKQSLVGQPQSTSTTTRQQQRQFRLPTPRTAATTTIVAQGMSAATQDRMVGFLHHPDVFTTNPPKAAAAAATTTSSRWKNQQHFSRRNDSSEGQQHARSEPEMLIEDDDGTAVPATRASRLLNKTTTSATTTTITDVQETQRQVEERTTGDSKSNNFIFAQVLFPGNDAMFIKLPVDAPFSRILEHASSGKLRASNGADAAAMLKPQGMLTSLRHHHDRLLLADSHNSSSSSCYQQVDDDSTNNSLHNRGATATAAATTTSATMAQQQQQQGCLTYRGVPLQLHHTPQQFANTSRSALKTSRSAPSAAMPTGVELTFVFKHALEFLEEKFRTELELCYERVLFGLLRQRANPTVLVAVEVHPNEADFVRRQVEEEEGNGQLSPEGKAEADAAIATLLHDYQDAFLLNMKPKFDAVFDAEELRWKRENHQRKGGEEEALLIVIDKHPAAPLYSAVVCFEDHHRQQHHQQQQQQRKRRYLRLLEVPYFATLTELHRMHLTHSSSSASTAAHRASAAETCTLASGGHFTWRATPIAPLPVHRSLKFLGFDLKIVPSRVGQMLWKEVTEHVSGYLCFSYWPPIRYFDVSRVFKDVEEAGTTFDEEKDSLLLMQSVDLNRGIVWTPSNVLYDFSSAPSCASCEDSSTTSIVGGFSLRLTQDNFPWSPDDMRAKRKHQSGAACGVFSPRDDIATTGVAKLFASQSTNDDGSEQGETFVARPVVGGRQAQQEEEIYSAFITEGYTSVHDVFFFLGRLGISAGLQVAADVNKAAENDASEDASTGDAQQKKQQQPVQRATRSAFRRALQRFAHARYGHSSEVVSKTENSNYTNSSNAESATYGKLLDALQRRLYLLS